MLISGDLEAGIGLVGVGIGRHGLGAVVVVAVGGVEAVEGMMMIHRRRTIGSHLRPQSGIMVVLKHGDLDSGLAR